MKELKLKVQSDLIQKYTHIILQLLSVMTKMQFAKAIWRG